MFALMIVSVVILPMMKVDPEEYKEMIKEKEKLTNRLTGGRGGGSSSSRGAGGGGGGQVAITPKRKQ